MNNEIINLPAALDGKIFLNQLGFGVELQTDFGLQVLYFANHAEIRLPSNYNSSTCGLCGNYNGNPADDFLLPSGNQTSSVDAFGQAWALTPPSVPCGGCEGPCLKSETAKVELYTGNDSCGLISFPAGPFSGCHRKVDPQPYVNNCAFDVYTMNGSLTSLCQSIQAYASVCQQAGLTIQAWRNSSFCREYLQKLHYRWMVSLLSDRAKELQSVLKGCNWRTIQKKCGRIRTKSFCSQILPALERA